MFTSFGQVQVLRTDADGGVLHARLDPGLRISMDQAGDFLADYYDLPKGQRLEVLRSLSGQDQEHIRYKHLINGVEVKGSQLIGHFASGVLNSFNGRLAAVIASAPQLSPKQAVETAILATAAQRYHWEDSLETEMLREWTGDPNVSYTPKAHLIYVPKELDRTQPYRLCYQVEINAIVPLMRRMIYVDALQGGVWAEEDLLHIGDAQGTANTRYRGWRTITTDSTAPNSYRLREAGRGNGIMTFNMQQGTSYAAAIDFTDADNVWNNYNPSFDEIATDAHFGAEMTYDYFLNRFNRNSFDNNGAAIRSYVHYRTNYANAFWNGYVMTYGDGNGTSWTPLTSIDVCGHEVSHAVTTYSAGLIYRYESGALNESFSDIFGNAIEYYADSTLFNWRIGEDIMVSGNGIRNMANPNTHGDPDTYGGLYWHTSPLDNGGVHTNSGVQNYWFYLLCTGDTGTNDNGDFFDVDSIGILKAEAIAYRNLTVYLGPNSQYEDARYYGIQSAADLFGPCSPEVEATTNAWYAVGVGPEYDSFTVKADFLADTFYCQGTELVQFNNRSQNATAYQWLFGDGNSSTTIHPGHSYGAQGTFTVTLIAEGCYNNLFDTLMRSNYITIDSTQDICNAVFMPAGDWDTLYACNIFVYDNGGEQDYLNLKRDTLTIVYGPADSAWVTFKEFDYEKDYDSVYIHDGPDPSAPLIGAFTGQTLPNMGAPILSTSGSITIRHFSDPYLVGTGFKLQLQAHRDSVHMQRTPDTLVCYEQSLRLQIWGNGGYAGDIGYWWNGIEGDSILELFPQGDTSIEVKFGDRCMRQYVVDTIHIQVRPALQLDSMPDTLVCHRQLIEFTAKASGGDTAGWTFDWSPFATQGNTFMYRFDRDTSLTLTVSDGCSPQGDTVSFEVNVRPDISYVAATDTTLCQGGELHIGIRPSGGLGYFWFTDSTGNLLDSGLRYMDTLRPLPVPSAGYWIGVSDGCTEGPDTVLFRYSVRDSLRLEPLQDTVICEGATALLHADASGGNGSYSYLWSSGLPNTSSPSLSPSSSTRVQLQLSDGCSEFEPTDSMYVKVLPALAVQIQGTDTFCYTQSVDLVALPSGGDSTSYTYQWNPIGQTDSALQYAFTASGRLVLTLRDGCSATDARDTLDYHVLEALQLHLPADTSICLGDAYTLSVGGSGGRPADYRFSWDQGQGLGPSKVLSPFIGTNYTITLTDGCSAPVNATFALGVHPLPTVEMQVDPASSCTQEEIRFTALDQGSGATYFWSFGDGKDGTGTPAYHRYGSSGNFDVTLRVVDANSCADSMEVAAAVEIVDRPIADFTYSPDVADFVDPEFRFSNRSQFADRYLWEFGDGSGSATSDPTHSYGDTGHYPVRLIAYNSLGCADSSLQWVQVKDVFVLHIPNAFSPNGDPLNPNWKIHARGVQELEMLVFNRWGEILWQSRVQGDSWDGTVGGDLIDAGLYFYQVQGIDFEGNSFSEQGELLILN